MQNRPYQQSRDYRPELGPPGWAAASDLPPPYRRDPRRNTVRMGPPAYLASRPPPATAASPVNPMRQEMGPRPRPRPMMNPNPSYSVQTIPNPNDEMGPPASAAYMPPAAPAQVTPAAPVAPIGAGMMGPQRNQMGMGIDQMGPPAWAASVPPTGVVDQAPPVQEAPTGKPYANELEQMFFQKRQELAAVRENRQIAEGLGSFQAVTPGSIRRNRPRPEKFVAEDLRKREEQLEFETLPENDPTSMVSRQKTRAINEITGQQFQEGQYSASQLDQMYPALVQLTASRERTAAQTSESATDRAFEAEQAELDRASTEKIYAGRASKQSEREREKNRRRQQAIFGAERGDLLKDTRIRKMRDAMDAADKVLNLINLGETNITAIHAGTIAMARASGDSGVLSNQDIRAWSEVPGLQGFFEKGYRFATSKATPQQIERLREVATSTRALLNTAYGQEMKIRRESFKITNAAAFEELQTPPEEIDRLYDVISSFSDGGTTGGLQAGPAPQGTIPMIYNGEAIEVAPEEYEAAKQAGAVDAR